ncbi:unnamed protein product [Acanthoscelides obtectus]|uniref:Carbohydrate sulfotransferase n=1 Tax=Acanthoscelides obtectus TaxID=200917 RepID=A0A9P0PX73_ACAOB|nr:unnamed protein product [Acanthoscelides obtectus]CAK1667787.1 Carbohydrate sulfotransferase 11 [Acanthoscelides obtectus]
MRLRRRKNRYQVSGWKVIRRCVVFFTAVCVVPVLLVLLVATDHYMRPVRKIGYVQRLTKEKQIEDKVFLNRDMNEVKQRLDQRRRHMKRTCKLLGLDKPGNDTLHRPNPWEFLVDTKNKLVWCNVFKAASTSWMYNFNILAGYSPRFLSKSKLVPMALARQRYPRPSLEALRKAFNDSVSFLIARHPFERLLSAYRDKLQYALPHTHHQKLGQEIIKKYREKLKKQQQNISQQRWPTFPEFVVYLLDSIRSGQAPDMHWAPITQFCTPCMFDFKIIAHTETLQDEQVYLIKVAKLEHLVKPEWRNAGKGATSQNLKKYYSQLTRSQILQLYHFYRYDFELFNYSVQDYLQMGIPDSDPNLLLSAIATKDFHPNEWPKIY